MNDEYTQRIITEGIAVGAITLATDAVIRSVMPNMNPMLRAFLLGMSIHYGAEYSGLNAWYLDNSAADMIRHHHKRKNCGCHRE
jgi:hypothetical protein